MLGRGLEGLGGAWRGSEGLGAEAPLADRPRMRETNVEMRLNMRRDRFAID